MSDILYSDLSTPFSRSEAIGFKDFYGPKGAGIACLPRAWTPPFVLISAKKSNQLADESKSSEFWTKVHSIAGLSGKLIVRSSVIGETIWERGKYSSIVVEGNSDQLEERIIAACTEVLRSAAGKQCGLVLQSYVEPRQRGEFGNLLRISKTRDQWELTTRTTEGTLAVRLNTQRDPAAAVDRPLAAKPRLSAERLFGSVAAWINNVLVRGLSVRLNCEWVSDNVNFYLVQLDEEDEDLVGINPLQLSVSPIHKPRSGSCRYLQAADSAAIARWDKLKVLDDLWGTHTEGRPNLYVLPLTQVPEPDNKTAVQELAIDFESLLGPNNIVVRTSVEAGQKPVNLPRTECLDPTQAANWCISEKHRLAQGGAELAKLAFVSHRYIDARACAWARADPNDPSVEIHSLWGLPDALQYCPYDSWEVHIPTNSATEYPDYKSNILLAHESGEWRYIRVKNEIARSLSISRKEALDIAHRSHEIATRLGRACHIMWFVGCADGDGRYFNIPWYWNEAHSTEKNVDRSRHLTFRVNNRLTLRELRSSVADKSRLMILLRPDDPELFRDNDFIKEVSEVARAHGIPIDLEGSTLAHAYYQLIALGCTVIARGEKDYLRVRKNVPFGKIVRDKIPDKIAARKELGITTTVPTRVQEAFLIGKVLEEALEVRESRSPEERKVELADLIEIIRTLAQAGGFTLREIVEEADKKRDKLGGFDEGRVLLQTGILGPGQTRVTHKSNYCGSSFAIYSP